MDASQISEDALREVWYRACEITGKDDLVNPENHSWYKNAPEEMKSDNKLYLRIRKEIYIAKKIHEHFQSLPEGEYDEEKK